MADRTVRVRLVADTLGFMAGMRAAGGATAAFGRQAAVAGQGSRALAAQAAAARGSLSALGSGARGGAAGVRAVDMSARNAAGGIRGAAADASRAGGAFGRMGSSARSAFGSLRGAAASALAPVRQLGTLLAGGAIVYGIADIVHQGNEYTSAMLKFQEVTRASGAQMQAAQKEAQALGSDIRLPGVSAAEAAEAMVELSKAGLSASDAMKSTRGTLQLAAAARTDVAQAAKIEGDIMDQFSLKSTQSTMVADTLANAVNNSSGELIDMYYAMKYVGPTAHSMNVSIKDAATTIGLLGKSGIIGETAGTTLRGMLVNLAKPTRQAKQGLKELGIEAFNSQGNFKGMEYVVGKLADAHHHLTQKEFTSAAAMAFGKPALSGATALAHQGATAFEQLNTQIGRTGGAADIAAAESKGLGGAMRTLGAQLQSAFLQVYLGIAPALENVTRTMSAGISKAIPYVKRGIKTLVDLWDIFGPGIKKKVGEIGSGIKDQAAKLIDPLKGVLKTAMAAILPAAGGALLGLVEVFKNAAHAVSPLVDGLAALISSVSSAGGALGLLSTGVGGVFLLLGHASAIIGPIASLVGGLAQAFGALPGPVQLFALSLLALKPFRGQISGMTSAVTGFGRSAVSSFRGLGDSILYQRVQAANAGVTLTRFGGAIEALSARSPVFARMADAFGRTSGAIQNAGGRLSGFRSALGGVAAAAGSGLLSGLKGLVSLMGGPLGIAVGGVMVGLDFLAKRQQEAAAAAAAHQARISSLTQALMASNGAIDAGVRASAVQQLDDAKLADGKTKLLDITRQAGLSTREVTDAYLGQGSSVGALRKHLDGLVRDHTMVADTGHGVQRSVDDEGKAYQAASDALGSMSGELSTGIKNQKDLADATKGSGDAAGSATDPTGRLKDAIDTLGKASSDADTKARALHEALSLLSGGELDVQAAVANMNASIQQLNSEWKDGVDHAKGFGSALLQADGSLNTTKENGQKLFNQLQAVNSETAGAAQATYDYARANKEGVVPALQQAEVHMQGAWDAAVQAGQKFGLAKDDAMQLANAMGFIPSSLAITMDTPGLSQTKKDLLFVQGLAGHMPAGSTITVSALTDDAKKQLEAVGVQIETLPGGRQMVITAPNEKAQKAIDEVIAKQIPSKTAKVDADTTQAIRDLEAVQAKVRSTKGRSIPMKALTGTAIAALESLGFKVTHMKDGTVTVTVPTGGPKASVAAIQRAINSVSGSSATVTVTRRTIFESVVRGGGSSQAAKNAADSMRANGSVDVEHFANGGMRENQIAQIAPAGAWRVWAEPSTGGESYIPLSPSKRTRSRKIAEETVRRLGGKGIAWYANGGVNAFADGGFTYTPGGLPVLGGASDPKSKYDKNVQDLKDAWKSLNDALADAKKKATSLRDAERNLSRVRHGHHTAGQLRSAQSRVDSARSAKRRADSKVASKRKDVYAADADLGLRKGAKVPTSFSLTGYQKQLSNSVYATDKWRKNLARIGQRGGEEVRSILEGMGEDGYYIVNTLAGASTKQFNDIVAKLKRLQGTAKATLGDFTKQLGANTTQAQQFAEDLQTLASRGFGDLAKSLAAQGDDTAMQLARQAVTGGTSAASAANTAVKKGNATLTGEDLNNALVVLAALRSKSGAGIADVIAAGVDFATLKTLVPKMLGQINKLPSAYKSAFLAQWAGQSVTHMYRGGILPDGSNTVLAGERGTGGEAFIPLGANNRGRSTGLLAAVAGQFGYHLSPVRGGGGGQTVVQNITKHIHVTLNGAKQSTAEQANDIARHMAFNV